MKIRIKKDKLKDLFRLEKNEKLEYSDDTRQIRRVKQHEKNKEENEDNYTEKVRWKKWKRKGSRLKASEFLKNIFLNKQKIKFNYYFLLIAMILLATGSVIFSIKSYNGLNSEEYINYASVNVFGKNKDLLNDNYIENEHIKEIEEKVVNVISNNVVVEKKLEFIKPLDGKIQKLYSPDKVIYSKTLDMWKVHNGLDISGNIGDEVVSIEDGIVTKIYNDSFFGQTIVIEHIQGYISSYSNLSNDVSVQISQKVKKGQLIGYVGDTSIGEIKDAPHIHFMMYKNDELIDPTNIF